MKITLGVTFVLLVLVPAALYLYSVYAPRSQMTPLRVIAKAKIRLGDDQNVFSYLDAKGGVEVGAHTRGGYSRSYSPARPSPYLQSLIQLSTLLDLPSAMSGVQYPTN